jgi:hypothetical protein
MTPTNTAALLDATVQNHHNRLIDAAEDLDPFLTYILTQAEAFYADWPVGEYDRIFTVQVDA